MPEVMSAERAAGLIADGSTVTISGTGPVLEPDLVLHALERRFLEHGSPRKLNLFTPMMPGDRPGAGGLNTVAHEGMLARIVGASFSAHRHPRLLDLIRAEKCEGYTIGMGPAIQLLGAISARKPGVFTTVGIGSFLDPRSEGGRMNARSDRPPVDIREIDGNEYLYYRSFPIDVAIIRGTTADEEGYISFEEEPNTLGAVAMAAAARASGGTVIVQVKRLARAHTLDPRLVRIPGALVDAIVVHDRQTQVSPHMADPMLGWNAGFAGAIKTSLSAIAPMPPGPGRVIVARAAMELWPGAVVNLGAGMATQLPHLALEEGFLDDVVFTNEHEIFGGLMASAFANSFVPAVNPDAIMDSGFQFAFYESGGLDATFLGVGEVDQDGNVNVSKYGKEWNGPGGFNSIIERTPRIVFCGSFTAGGFRAELADGRLVLHQEGRVKKWVRNVEQVTFNAQRALRQGQSVTYVTERAVFRLSDKGPELTEIAPGVDLDRDIRGQMAFVPRVAEDVRPMESGLFGDGALGLKKHILDKARKRPGEGVRWGQSLATD